jgi:hypothetical protein
LEETLTVSILVSLPIVVKCPFVPMSLQQGHKVGGCSLDIRVPGFNMYGPQIRVYLDYDEQPMVDLLSTPRLSSWSCPPIPVYLDYDEYHFGFDRLQRSPA